MYIHIIIIIIIIQPVCVLVSRYRIYRRSSEVVSPSANRLISMRCKFLIPMVASLRPISKRYCNQQSLSLRLGYDTADYTMASLIF